MERLARRVSTFLQAGLCDPLHRLATSPFLARWVAACNCGPLLPDEYFQRASSSYNQPTMNRKETKNKKSAATNSEKVSFLVPSNHSSQSTIFPPLLWTTHPYPKTILLNDPTYSRTKCSVQIPANYGASPVFSDAQSRLWHMKHGAVSAAYQRFPANVARLIGTITRTLTEETSIEPREANSRRQGPFAHYKAGTPVTKSTDASNAKNLSKFQAKKEATRECDIGMIKKREIESRVDEILGEWERIKQTTHAHHWDRHGNPVLASQNDASFCSIAALRSWMKAGGTSIQDSHANSTTTLYGRQFQTNVDTAIVLEALAELSDPSSLWMVPVITAYPTVALEREEEIRPKYDAASRPKKRPKATNKDVRRTWKVRIGVYASRLLSEAMTQNLRTVMAALDVGSYRITQPLHVPPQAAEQVFESSPYPIVVYDNCDDDESGGEEKKSEHDMTFGDSTREEARISAYSTKGLLKLLENHGCSTTGWESKIEPKLSGLKLDLMLHQKHAVCWMLQMESIEGFGINSIIWEEREFLDGGKYYYAPALGQLRLDRPPTMKGGLLTDEMGLGKTLQILSLILVTLDDLKADARRKRDSHATLIIVPPALVGQWLSEIAKTVKEGVATVDYLDFKTGDTTRHGSSGEPDIVLTTYQALDKPAVLDQIVGIKWGRIVLDEMQEIRRSTSKIAKSCAKLDCCRRWMISGTPLFDGLDDLRGELNFLRVAPFSASTEDGFFDFSILNHWEQHSVHAIETLRILGFLMLRRSKDMTIKATGAPIMGLKPLTVEFKPVVQSDPERAVYCFLECLVARELRAQSSGATLEGTTRVKCLRFLRDVCNSTVLLNGGLGVPSQLKSLNHIVKAQQRRVSNKASMAGSAGVMSCDEAIRHLAQAQEETRTEKDFKAEMKLGFGGGVVRRARAGKTVEDQLKASEKTIEEATASKGSAISKRARLRWHLALEALTTGEAPYDDMCRANLKFRNLWLWRKNMAAFANSKLPLILRRGWRPRCNLIKEILSAHSDFVWAHPYSCFVRGIPDTVSPSKLGRVIQTELGITSQQFEVRHLNYRSAASCWTAGLVFTRKRDASALLHYLDNSEGIILAGCNSLPKLRQRVQEARAMVDEAAARCTVHPSDKNLDAHAKAKRDCARLNQGLRIVKRGDPLAQWSVLLDANELPSRSSSVESKVLFIEALNAAQNEYNESIAKGTNTVDREKERCTRLQKSKGIPDDVKALSAFDSLQALCSGQPELTQCPICLDYLGYGEGENIALIKCGHLFCTGCLKNCENTKCPSCRRPFGFSKDVVLVDPSKVDPVGASKSARNEAREVVRAAARIVEESHGQLEPEMWQTLYNTFELPDGADTTLDVGLSSLPRDFLAHLRASTALRVNLRASEPKQSLEDGLDLSLSSKIRALLQDLPKNERCVVFSSSGDMIQHLCIVLTKLGIGFRALYVGLNVEDSKKAVSEWQSGGTNGSGEVIPFPVLLLQGRTAAAGLTLTAACKMFLMEPFVRFEEEQQAYARLHRYGQLNAVHCRCYYTPCSVESRLLQWRRLSASESNPVAKSHDSKIFYRSIDDNDGEDQEDSQTSFLLGL